MDLQPCPGRDANKLRARRARIFRRPFLEVLEARWLPSGSSLPGTTPDPAAQAQVAAQYGQLPLAFEINHGQTNSQVQFLSRGSGYALFLTGTGAVLSLQQPTAAPALSVGLPGLEENLATPPAATSDVALALNLVGANPQALVSGLDLLPGISNYFIGNDPSQWRTNIPNYGQVEYLDVYPGVNLVYYGNQQQLEYDFVVAPGADPGRIRFAVQGPDSISLDDQGNLVLHTAFGDVLEHAPILYQEAGGARQAVAGQFVLLNQDEIGFQVGAYDPSLPLTIDPTLSYSTYLGGNSDDEGYAIAIDSAGNAFVTGYTKSTNFPTTAGAFQTSHASDGGSYDAFVAKLNAAGTALIYSTYLGGNNLEYAKGIALDSAGNAYVTGLTTSTNFPTTAGAFQTSHASDGGGYDGFMAKLNAAGTALIYSTYLGGNKNDIPIGIALDSAGNAYVTAYTQSTDFPTTAGAFQTSHASDGGKYDAFVAKLNNAGTGLIYSTYLGGTSDDFPSGIALDSAGNAYVIGYTTSTNFPTTAGAFQTNYGGNGDAFVAKLNAGGTALIYSTYLGGNNQDAGYAIALDSAGNAYVTGYTYSSNFPTTAGAFQTSHASDGGQTDTFVAKLNAAGTALIYSTYLGGNSDDEGYAIAIDSAGNAYVTGQTFSTNFPTTADAFQTSRAGNGSTADAFVAKLNGAGTALIYSTYLGGNSLEYGYGIALDAAGNAYVTGQTYSSNFPTTAGAFQTNYGGNADAFVAKFIFTAATSTTLTSSVNPSLVGQTVIFSATVTPANGIFDNGGTVQFAVDGSNIGPPATLNGGVAIITDSGLSLGTHTITAVYGGDTLFLGSSGTLGGGQAVDQAALTGTNQFAQVANAFANPLVVTITDSSGHPVPNLVVGFTAPSNGASGTFNNSSTTISGTTNASGQVSEAFTANTSAGSYPVTVSVGGVITPLSFALINTGGPAVKFLVAGPATATGGLNFNYFVQAEDGYGNPTGFNTTTITFTTTDPQVPTLPSGMMQFPSLGIGSFQASLRTASAAGWTITATSGALTGTSAPIAVSPGPPTHFSLAVPATAGLATPIGITVTALDAFGNTVTGYSGTVRLSSTDPAARLGAVTLPATFSFLLNNGTDTLINVTLNTPGNQTLTATDTTAINPSITGTSSAIVAFGLQVTSVTGTPTGFTVNFNEPFLLNSLHLYGTGNTTQPDVRVFSNTIGAPLSGSLVGNAGQTSFTFVESTLADQTGGLPDGSYVVSLLDSPAAITDVNGFPLDVSNSPNSGPNQYPGNPPAYTTTFTLNTRTNLDNTGSQVAISLPAFAQGPGAVWQNLSGPPAGYVSGVPGFVNVQQPFSNPVTYFGGIPAIISDGNNATTASFQATYNTALLTVTGAQVDVAAQASYPSASFTRTAGTPAAGMETDTFTFNTNGAPLATGQPWTLGELLASVPNTANQTIYHAKQLLPVTAVSTDGTLPAVGGKGFQVVAYLGDGSGDGQLTTTDAALANNVALGHDSGFAAFPLVDPEVLADTDAQNVVDGTTVSNLAFGGAGHTLYQIPTPPAGANVNQAAPDPDLSIPVQARAVNGVVSVPIMLDNAKPGASTGITEATLALKYDPKLLTLTAADVHLGNIPDLGTGWTECSVIDPARGQIAIELYSLTPITAAVAGSLATVDFHLLAGATGPATVSLVDSVTPFGSRAFNTNVADTQGALILGTSTGVVSVAAAATNSAALPGGAGGFVILPAQESIPRGPVSFWLVDERVVPPNILLPGGSPEQEERIPLTPVIQALLELVGDVEVEPLPPPTGNSDVLRTGPDWAAVLWEGEEDPAN